MAAVNVTGTFASTSKWEGSPTGLDVRVLKAELNSTVGWQLHLTGLNPSRHWLTIGTTVLTTASTADLQALARLLATAVGA